MQDLKHLSRKKPFTGFTPSGIGFSNRRIKSTRVSGRLRLLPSGKRLYNLKLTLLGLAVILGIFPLYRPVVSYVTGVYTSLRSGSDSQRTQQPKQPDPPKPPAALSSFTIAGSLLETAEMQGDSLMARTSDGRQLTYTIMGGLQKRVHDYLERNKVPYGVFVAIEPATGRILGMTSYSARDNEWSRTSMYGLYPMASLFKIITASAALESRKITPESVVEFRGNSYSENPRYWEISPRGKNNRLDVTYALGKSINPVYGRMASEIAGKKSVMESVSRFGFNQELLPGVPVKASQAAEPTSDHGLMLMGAGLNHDVKISPLHAAVIMSAIANGGKMMAPGLTSSIADDKGVQGDLFTPRELRRLVTPETAASLTRMLSSTVLTGTSRKAFHDRRGRPLINVPIAAKTGSINGTDPKGHYSWFAAFAPINSPRIALVALVINPDKWRVKASQVGEQALEEFFKH
ncbi:MAG TPA: penicillin-binding protein [Desulfuromonadales bacterium]|nr:penicillin-binding protein [Desulfuromonadales bacterium]